MTYRNIKLFEKYKILARDGEIGTLHDFLFDDISWTIRYLVVNVGTWLSGRKVLLSPQAIEETLWEDEQFKVNLSKQQIEDSPSFTTEPPVSLQKEIDLHEYYKWSFYWTPGGMTPIYPTAGAAPIMLPSSDLEDKELKQDSVKKNPHLRSTNEVMGYHINATDGEIGHVEDFLADDEHWALHYMVVDTRNWLPGRKVLVSPEWISMVSWEKRQVAVNMTQDAVKDSPEYALDIPMTRDDEDSLLQHYDVEKIRPGLAAYRFFQK